MKSSDERKEKRDDRPADAPVAWHRARRGHAGILWRARQTPRADESGIATVGISQSIDPGNFDTEESALVQLDALSAPGGARDTTNPSLLAYYGPHTNKVAFIGQAVGNAAAHEAGHFFGSWHTAPFDDIANLMDQGGNFAVLWGVGPDNLGGTDDDDTVRFGRDTFNPAEGFTGTEDTRANTLWALSGIWRLAVSSAVAEPIGHD